MIFYEQLIQRLFCARLHYIQREINQLIPTVTETCTAVHKVQGGWVGDERNLQGATRKVVPPSFDMLFSFPQPRLKLQSQVCRPRFRDASLTSRPSLSQSSMRVALHGASGDQQVGQTGQSMMRCAREPSAV